MELRLRPLPICLLAIALAGAWVVIERPWFIWRHADPVEMMADMVRHFPPRVRQGKRVVELWDVTFNVEKTDSLSAPVVGTIEFSQPLWSSKDVRYAAVFHWHALRWRYQRLMCLTGDVDGPTFVAKVESTPEFQQFIGNSEQIERETASEEDRLPDSVSPPAPPPIYRPLFTPKPTPTREQMISEIERTYGPRAQPAPQPLK